MVKVEHCIHLNSNLMRTFWNGFGLQSFDPVHTPRFTYLWTGVGKRKVGQNVVTHKQIPLHMYIKMEAYRRIGCSTNSTTGQWERERATESERGRERKMLEQRILIEKWRPFPHKQKINVAQQKWTFEVISQGMLYLE